ncbi:beta-defensin 3 precursor [Mus musculus]|uniref:Beta-defensin 3 n=1 Tax=Mus musculus TaxID=10090 RepID=DEFB3_MOUSE|nr:beta-defensin 3 precursor [Mus musculus]Q9WTL0.1 RecName: Full=Beta-defensin 3; Short=BD-3; Short=mBD-3; AltName: Full=Defensin, beta 3; Flags: Precursor [Mus musculus]AAD29572.1 beta-defensin 3 [Mus musculus]AAD29573.1 beta-defensin 3 [Mus musculus]AAI14345.1 Defensin beta 3 [Mus musculus]AAI16177.1 Defensin beta 3 [Mus musculus]AAI16178.1 Defensin beta 3 [Mus musculus]|eukprot:NP_038784.1 beta-defensin 3 precursor [Mus musculus]
MRIHYLLFAFLLVLLSPPAAFSKKINNPVSCLRKGGRCWNRCIGNTRQIGSCGVPFLKCCKRK